MTLTSLKKVFVDQDSAIIMPQTNGAIGNASGFLNSSAVEFQPHKNSLSKFGADRDFNKFMKQIDGNLTDDESNFDKSQDEDGRVASRVDNISLDLSGTDEEPFDVQNQVN